MKEVVTCLMCGAELSGNDLVISMSDDEDFFCSEKCVMDYLRECWDLKKRTANELLTNS